MEGRRYVRVVECGRVDCTVTDPECPGAGLHRTFGPARTTLGAVAELAGVKRDTAYAAGVPARSGSSQAAGSTGGVLPG
jgi:hypothetical protein